jgi:hypothetical protein
MITKPEHANPTKVGTLAFVDGLNAPKKELLVFTVEQTIEIAMAYAQSILDAQSGAYGASEEQERWLDKFAYWSREEY